MAPNVEPRPSSRPQKLQQPSPWRRERTGDGFEVLHRHLVSRAGAAVPLLSATRARLRAAAAAFPQPEAELFFSLLSDDSRPLRASAAHLRRDQNCFFIPLLCFALVGMSGEEELR